ncbi:MAG: hypothetical protein NZ772_08005 [Cyanobacteria bacterium]|nr:hypothetical protein [Cyanobacteriota bacterium]MDW8201426.1 hypothetical protein [Cyanobacteriota bacterium SKYGB_h_bin112]
MKSVDDAVPLRKLDDLSLMRKFFAGEGTLLSNQNLRAEAGFNNEFQLLSKREGVVATLKLDKPATASIRGQSAYQALLHEALEDNGFVLMSSMDQQGFIPYQKYKIPEGYRLNCTEARYLWREWWTMYKSHPRAQSPLQMNLLVLAREQWYPIREMVSSQGMLYIKTLVKEIVLDGSSQIAWLNRRVGGLTMPLPQKLHGVEAEINSDDATQVEVPETSRFMAPEPSKRRVHPAIASRQITKRLTSSSVVEQTALPRRESSRSLTPESGDPWSDPRVRQQTPTFEDNQKRQVANREAASATEPKTQPLALHQPSSNGKHADIGTVLKFRDGRIHIATVIGELVVEGNDLKFWLNSDGEKRQVS